MFGHGNLVKSHGKVMESIGQRVYEPCSLNLQSQWWELCLWKDDITQP